MPKLLSESETKKLLKRFLPLAKSRPILFEKDLTATKQFPAVLKLISQKFTHKSDIGAVIITRNSEELFRSYNRLLKVAKKKKIRPTIIMQEFIEGKEIIIGIKKDPVFGHVIMLGLGGIFAEQIRDVTFRKCPISPFDSRQMINDLKYKKILEGIRGTKKANLKLLESILVRVSKIPLKYRKILEMDINPLILNDRLAKVVDARVVVE